MFVHSCSCIIFCVAWFEVRFQINLNLHFEIALEKLKKENEFPSFPFSPLSAYRPAPAPMAASPCRPAHATNFSVWPSISLLFRGTLRPAQLCRRPRSAPRPHFPSLSESLTTLTHLAAIFLLASCPSWTPPPSESAPPMSSCRAMHPTPPCLINAMPRVHRLYDEP